MQVQGGGKRFCRFLRQGCVGIENGKEALAAGGPPPSGGEIWVRFPEHEKLDVVLKPAMWQCQRQTKKYFEKERRENEAGEERKCGEDDEDAAGFCLPTWGGGGNSGTHPPRNLAYPQTDKCPTPPPPLGGV